MGIILWEYVVLNLTGILLRNINVYLLLYVHKVYIYKKLNICT